MLTVFVVIAGALVIVAIAAAVNRRRDSLPYSARTSGTDDAAASWVPVMTDGGSDCNTSDAGAGVMVAAEVASRISYAWQTSTPNSSQEVPCRIDRQLCSSLRQLRQWWEP